MSKQKSFLLILFISVSSFLLGQEKTEVLGISDQAASLPTSLTDTIPFQLTTHNNISIQAVLNQRDILHLMFHTAANGITLIKEATKRMTSVNFNNKDTVNSWGGENASRYSKNNTLQIGEFTWENLSIWENENSGPTTDGKFGPNLFEGKCIEINYDKNIIVIHTSLPAISKDYEKLSLVFENSSMFMEGSSNIGERTYKNRFLIHSGFGGSLLLDDTFVQENNIGDQLQIIDEKSLKDSYGNVLKTKKAILPSFMLGKITFENIPIGFFEGSIGRQKMSVMGGDVLKRFNIIIDSERANIYLQANNLMNVPFSDI